MLRPSLSSHETVRTIFELNHDEILLPRTRHPRYPQSTSQDFSASSFYL